MHDRGQFWSPIPDWSSAALSTAAVSARPAAVGAAWQLSGEWGGVLTRLGVGAVRGPRDRCADARYALRLSPDSVLLVGADALDLSPGWHDAGYAATDLGDALVVVDVDGTEAAAVMSAGSEYPFDDTASRPHESARMQFAGHTVVVSRRAAGWRLHVPRPWAAALWRWIEAQVE